MAYDPVRQQVVLFGGGSVADTWLWNGSNWTQASPAVSPPPRGAASMAFDAAHSQMVLFGGIQPNSATARLGDTWLWDGTNWTQPTVSNGPSARDGQAMAYDAVHGQMVMFGGIDLNGSPLNETWLWNGSTWTQASPAHVPSTRFSHSMAYDAATGQVMLFGGETNGQYTADTWIWSGTDWILQNLTSAPSARYSAAMDYDAALGQVVLFGGYNGTYLNDTWYWSGSGWTQALPVVNPSPREFNQGMSYDAARGEMLLFGGDNFANNPTQLGDTWKFGVPGNFGNVNVCPQGQITPAPCSTTIDFTYPFPNGATLGTPVVLTQGIAGKDFSVTNSGAAACSGTVLPGYCTVSVTFTPQAPGARAGVVELTDNAGNVISSSPVHGVGQAPAVAFAPAVQTALPFTGLQAPVGVTVDAAGNTYVADSATGKVTKLTHDGVQTTIPTSGLSAPVGVAVDGAGNLYIVDINQGFAVKVTPGGVQTTLGSELNSPTGIAVDAAGDVFISDQNANRVVEITPAGVQTTVPATGLNQPSGVAVDAQGNVFIVDGGNSRVVEVTGGGIQTTVPTSNLLQPYGVAVDAAGDLFIGDPQRSRVVEVPAGGGAQTTVVSGLNYPSGVAVDAAGNIFIGDQGARNVWEINRSQPPSLSFADTNVQSTSSDSPRGGDSAKRWQSAVERGQPWTRCGERAQLCGPRCFQHGL